ncbi:hypothetical protein ACIRRA_34700 [Nocardia sp. NPDC101769]|uniref:hypothetical protein n=1 Tax=Nocardia sp. NPDC101769 TaxID=3364333 RepID=UPI003829E794
MGIDIACPLCGHDGKTGGTTATYVKSDILEVAAALSILTAEPHPLVSNPESHVRAIDSM